MPRRAYPSPRRSGACGARRRYRAAAVVTTTPTRRSPCQRRRRAPSRPPRSSGADPAGPKPRRRPMPSLPQRLTAARRTGFDEYRRSAMPWNEGTLRRTPTYESSWTRRVSWCAVWKSSSELGIKPPRHRFDAIEGTSCVDCVESARHRADAVIGTTSRRWREAPEI